MPKVLIIDDDRAVHRMAGKAVANLAVEVFSASDGEEGIAAIEEHRPDVLLLDIMLPGISGIELAKQIRELDSKLPVIFITAINDSDAAIEAMKLGAYEYLLKPLDLGQVESLVERALDTRRLMQSPVHLPEGDEPAEDGDVLVGRSPRMLDVYKQIGRVAGQDVTVLIRGESGTGKELIARAIYQHSHRSDECFLAVNCAALTDTLLESELFGHEKGAFTGADRQHIGKFEQCHDGTIFLDEVGDMSPLTQSKVLRLLQDQKFERVGGRETIDVDVRMIAATNRHLEEMIDEEEFRLDLFHRLNAFEIFLPPLRERAGDIDLLLDHFLLRFNKSLDKDITGISEEAIQLLRQYSWPGNVRELQSVVRKAMLMSTGPVIVPEFLPAEVRGGEHVRPAASKSSDTRTEQQSSDVDLVAFVQQRIEGESDDIYAETLAEMERCLLTRVLRHTGGNQSQAAARLGITRGSLRNKIRSLGISIEQNVVSEKSDASSEDSGENTPTRDDCPCDE